MQNKPFMSSVAVLAAGLLGAIIATLLPEGRADAEPAVGLAQPMSSAKSEPTKDWPMWGGNSLRNNVPVASDIPTDWNIGRFDRKTGEWDSSKAENIKWVAKLGSQSYGNPVVASGKVFVGTNNSSGLLPRYPSDVDLGVLVCYDEKTGDFLWQHSSEKLSTGRVHDWPLQGICCAPYVEGNRLWFVTSRGEVRCLDVEGFHDGENDGPYTEEKVTDKDEADVIWVFNMMEKLGVSQHNMCSCSITALGDILFVNTSNGVDESHIVLPSPDAPSFIAMNKNTGEVLWTDGSPGENILHGQWSSPTVAELGGVPQVLFAGGDGWVYSFKADGGKDGKPELLWKFDGNPKESKWVIGGRGTRNNIIATPVVYDGKVYVAVGQDPEHGEGEGHLWCIDPTKRGDVSPQLAMKVEGSKRVPLPHRRIQAVIAEDGEVAVDNPNSAVIWHYGGEDFDGDGRISFEETMHRSIGTVAIKDDILYISDFSGLFHCLDAKTGKRHWTYDMLAAAWGSPLIVGGHVYIGDEDGDVCVFKLSTDPDDAEPINEVSMGNSVYSTPIVANGVLYIANKTHLFAIEAPKQ
ncbi:PQQ-binding-like beta-propeller repeat protein [Blastopirellula marina]|uniref:Serine/threonine protein kinase n=1 Tax=Blastopirellula marina TaxID=124 RepID=A0A2S8GSY9_9BACT|nr:PQQ-binding-like beta-propeller repeat protein [Blastopirellula marina]PQO47537.1 serine/threonine protein kinase [Blastopirellula marina]